ncbi:MAG: response regulator [Selenomonadaceae bacterium]|nr:response regulator [Selenomonadaceae bacterium]
MKNPKDDANETADWTTDLSRQLTVRAIVEFVIIAIVLSTIGWLVHCHVMTLLDEAMEESMRRHIGTLTYSVEQQMQQELTELHMGASLVESGQVDVKGMIDVVMIHNVNKLVGIVGDDGSTLVGNQFPVDSFELIAPAFDGQDVVVYKKGVGIIFAAPMRINGEVYAVYNIYNDKNIHNGLGVVSYDGQGRVTIGYKTGDWTEISLGPDNGEFYDELGKNPNFLVEYRTAILDDTINYGKVVKHFEFDGENYMIFSSLLSNEDFAIFGIVKRDVMAIGIDYIHAVMIGVAGLLIFILIMIGRYLIKSIENKELQREKQLADRSNQMKSDFLANMSHELRTPLNAILGMDEMILRGSRENDTVECAENIRIAGNNLLGLVNDILDFSKIEAGKMEIINVDYQLSSVLNDLVNMIHPRVDKKGLQLIANADENLPTMLFGDEIRIKQVVTNILTNAVKYTEKGSVTLTVDFKKIADDKILLRFEVKDTGIGIKQEDIPKLFSAFERIEEKRNRTIEGTGLGMNITQKLLQLMNTKLNVSSVYGEGSTFSFEVEQRVLDWTPLGNFEEAFRNSLTQRKIYHEKFIAPTANILVVDDTVMNLTVVKGLLKQTRIQITTAESGFECLDLVRQRKFDIIFLDHRMPTMDGMETLQKMRELDDNLNDETPVIALTANAISGAREQYLAASFRDYLSKPIDPTALETMIMKYLPPEKIEEAPDDDRIEPPKLDLPDWLTAIDGIDVQKGVGHCGSAEDYLNALKVFAQSIKDNADEIESMFRAELWKDYTTKVHALKSTARVIGAETLSDLAKAMEDAGNANDLDAIRKSTAPLLEMYRSFADKLSPLIERSDDEDKPPITEDDLNEAVEALREAAASFDYDSVTFILDQLDEYRLPDDQIERFKRIRVSASKLDWEELLRGLDA